jgi:hypothetical protein
MEQLKRFIDGKMLTSVPYETITALDILLRHKLTRTMSPIGSNLYSQDTARSLGGGLDAWLGYHQSVSLHLKILLNFLIHCK